MTKKELIDEVSEKTFASKQVVSTIFDALVEVLKDTVATKKEEVFLRGFGTFKLKHRATKKARNITTGETVIVEAHDVPFFKPSKEFVDMV